ncbi:MAG: LptF/LptG family permease, partial [FCB group bacterium]|nr:LptF/LptG family permease [FCB group bacterium]
MILTRYIIREMTIPFFLSLLLIIMMFILNLLFQMLGKIAGKGLELDVIIEFFFLNMAWIVALAVPMAVLIATLMAFGRLSSDNEVTALKASGVSIISLMKPAIIFGIVVMAALFYFSDRVLPEFNHRSRLLSSDISRKKPTINIEEGVFHFDVPNIVMRAQDIDEETSMMRGVVIYNESDRKYQTTIIADSGRLDFSYASEQFIMTLYDGTIHRIEKQKPENYQETEYKVSLFRMDAPEMMLRRRESSYRSDREQSSGMMMEQVIKLRKEPKPNTRRINAFLVEINKKYSIPAACLVFTIIGVPMGVMFRSGGLGVSGGLAGGFLPGCLVCLVGGGGLSGRGAGVLSSGLG